MKEISTRIDIAATADVVWTVLTEFDQYPKWNPFIREISGTATAGQRLVVHIEPPGGRAMTFRPTVLRAEPSREFRWRGRLVAPGLFDGEHIFEIEEGGGGVTLDHREEFTGLLVPLFWKGMAEPTRRGFEAMNVAIKERAESRRS